MSSMNENRASDAVEGGEAIVHDVKADADTDVEMRYTDEDTTREHENEEVDGAKDPNESDDHADTPDEALEREKAIADITTNWGLDFSTMRDWIPEDTWLKGETEHMTEQNCRMDTIRGFQSLSEMTKGQGQEIKDQIDQFYLIRWFPGGGVNRSIDKSRRDKERNIRDDLRRLREGEWVRPEERKDLTKRRKGKSEGKKPNKKRSRKAQEEDNSGAGREEIAPTVATILSEAQRDAALRRIYHNWQITSLHSQFPSMLHERTVSDDSGIHWSIVELLRNLSEVSSTREQGREIRKGLAERLSRVKVYELDQVRLRITMVAADYFKAAEEPTQRQDQEDDAGNAEEQDLEPAKKKKRKDNSKQPASGAGDDDIGEPPTRLIKAQREALNSPTAVQFTSSSGNGDTVRDPPNTPASKKGDGPVILDQLEAPIPQLGPQQPAQPPPQPDSQQASRTHAVARNINAPLTRQSAWDAVRIAEAEVRIAQSQRLIAALRDHPTLLQARWQLEVAFAELESAQAYARAMSLQGPIGAMRQERAIGDQNEEEQRGRRRRVGSAAARLEERQRRADGKGGEEGDGNGEGNGNRDG